MEYHINLHIRMSKMRKYNNGRNKNKYKNDIHVQWIMEETRSNLIIILIGGKSYTHERQKLSNLKNIQTIWFHQLIVFVL
jgi:hypothetical protein